MEHQKCYVFEPKDERPRKKRKVDHENWERSWKVRKETYEQLWTRQNARIEQVLNKANEGTVNQVANFVSDSRSSQLSNIPAGFISAGPNIASHSTLFRQIASELRHSDSNIFVTLGSSECSNLKSLLKALIAKATARGEEDEVLPLNRKGPKLLNFDLQLLHDYVKENSIETVVVAFQDTEAFDGHVLSDAIDLFGIWHARIPFVLLFGIATSTESLQDRLSRSALRCLEGKEFDVVQTDKLLEQVFLSTIDSSERSIWMGPGLVSMLLDRQKDHVQNITEFVDALKYAYMSHFFANITSIFMADATRREGLSSDHYEAVRNLPSFQEEIVELLASGGASEAKKFLEDDSSVAWLVDENLGINERGFRRMASAIRLSQIILSKMPKLSHTTVSSLYAKAIGGKLKDSPVIRETILFLKRAPSDMLVQIMEESLSLDVLRKDDVSTQFYFSAHVELKSLLKDIEMNDGALRSEFDVRNDTLRTTVVAKKVELSKQKATLSKNDAAYSKLLQDFVQRFESYLNSSLFNPGNMMFLEISTYDIKQPTRASFAPKIRFAIERALSSPHDYLNCDCCKASEKEDEAALSASQPATAVLYQLYLESGNLINVSDLYTAFHAILEERIDDEDRIKALFQRSLAEMKYIGLIKGSKKKVDHIAKAAWKGL